MMMLTDEGESKICGAQQMNHAHDDSEVNSISSSIPRVAITVRDDMYVVSNNKPEDESTIDDIIEVSGESSEVETLLLTNTDLSKSILDDSLNEYGAHIDGDQDEKGFLHRVGKSIKNLFGCVNKPKLDLGTKTEDALMQSNAEIPMQNIAHSWITQTTTATFNPFPGSHQSLIIDLPPSLPHPILPLLHIDDTEKKCLVLDLDETLVHSSFLPVASPDYILNMPLLDANADHTSFCQSIYVCKRPGVDIFLQRVCKLFEVVIFTASLSNYADPVINFLDPDRLIRHRLYREDCVMLQGLYIKDLSRLGRSLDKTAIVDNSPASYLLQPHCAVAIKSWFNDPDDLELSKLLPALTALAAMDGSVGEWRSSWSI